MIPRMSWASQVDGSSEHLAFALPLFWTIPYGWQPSFHIFIAVCFLVQCRMRPCFVLVDSKVEVIVSTCPLLGTKTFSASITVYVST